MCVWGCVFGDFGDSGWEQGGLGKSGGHEGLGRGRVRESGG